MFEIKEFKNIKAKDPRTGATLFELDFPIKIGFDGNPCPDCGCEDGNHACDCQWVVEKGTCNCNKT